MKYIPTFTAQVSARTVTPNFLFVKYYTSFLATINNHNFRNSQSDMVRSQLTTERPFEKCMVKF